MRHTRRTAVLGELEDLKGTRMSLKTIDVCDIELHLQELLALVATGTEIILTQGNQPFARILPIAASAPERVAGLHAGAIWTSDDFDDPLPEEFWADNS